MDYYSVFKVSKKHTRMNINSLPPVGIISDSGVINPTPPKKTLYKTKNVVPKIKKRKPDQFKFDNVSTNEKWNWPCKKQCTIGSDSSSTTSSPVRPKYIVKWASSPAARGKWRAAEKERFDRLYAERRINAIQKKLNSAKAIQTLKHEETDILGESIERKAKLEW